MERTKVIYLALKASIKSSQAMPKTDSKNGSLGHFPTSIHRKIELKDVFVLQNAIYLTFTEKLDKRATLDDWGCGLDTESGMFKMDIIV